MVSDGPPRLVPSPGQDKRLATTVVVGAEGLAEKKGREKTKERKKKATYSAGTSPSMERGYGACRQNVKRETKKKKGVTYSRCWC